ncbi:hypothetical protein RFI_15519 [Reticulomyxa filosa]|uniref:Uncharacterized protein n=1 Tax=Reticulomyxa filosa TaxID=46433 RepID=X6N7F0_RETFI|nr:hypothetical protein RFI_15519 [Reticulomyxa filosa]|eukprot:ETO21684.1 hypothetical protein RFI_15519 [Reticulomyxa filosa]
MNTFERKNKAKVNLTQSNNTSFFQKLSNDKSIEKKNFSIYLMYVIKGKVVILDEVTIDGNVYAIDCEVRCKGSVAITTQLFMTKNAIVDQQLIHVMTPPIQWDTKTHHDIPLQLQDPEDKAEQCSEKKLFNEAIPHLQTHLQLCIDLFGTRHHYVGISYNLLGLAYDDNRQFKKAIQSFEKSLEILSNIFGVNCTFVAQLYYNLGLTYYHKGDYNKCVKCDEQALIIRLGILNSNDESVANSYNALGNAHLNLREYNKSIEYHTKSLQIRKEIFGNENKDVGDSYWNLALAFELNGQGDAACKYYEDSWKVCNIVLGEWYDETVQAKQKVKKLSASQKTNDKFFFSCNNSFVIKRTLFFKHCFAYFTFIGALFSCLFSFPFA